MAKKSLIHLKKNGQNEKFLELEMGLCNRRPLTV